MLRFVIDSKKSTFTPENGKRSPSQKVDTSSNSRRLNLSEIKSLRKDWEQGQATQERLLSEEGKTFQG